MTRQKAKEALKDAFEEISDIRQATERFAILCYEIHRSRLLSDTQISKVIGNRYSRSGIQNLRKKIERQKEREE